MESNTLVLLLIIVLFTPPHANVLRHFCGLLVGGKNDMNNFELNKAIAEICGWTNCCLSVESVYGFSSERKWVGIPPNRISFEEVPNYVGDLNAISHAEEIMSIEQLQVWADWLGEITKDQVQKFHDLYSGSAWHITYRATARQRAEAFLRTFNKWKN